MIVFFQVWINSARDQARPVDAIVVLGAAQWDGVPSPVLEARLEQALKLYEEGLSPIIVTTGSKQTGDRFTEAYAGFTYLLERAVPEKSILELKPSRMPILPRLKFDLVYRFGKRSGAPMTPPRLPKRLHN